ncbi:MAG: hypothetical protein Fur0032_09640 [Terrimicrobiaceae bacterium]
MSYRVFARKYRPQKFEDVVGQEHVTRTLQNAIRESRVAQAYMFVGPRGIGKTSCARILAKALNCESGTTANPCGQCSSCQEIAEGRSLDVLEIDGASNNGVENIRDLREGAAYSPARGPYKIYLIDEVHMLSAGAFNALLKTLEEPPPHVKFIFATTEAQKVPATITSRCQRFDLRRIPTPSIASHLQLIAEAENIQLEPAAADAIARAAEGGLRDAESMLDQAVAFCGNNISTEGVMSIFGFTARETIASLTDYMLARDTASALAVITAQADAGKDLSRLMADLTAHLRDLLVQGVSADSPTRRDQLISLLDHFGETEGRLRWASDKKLQFDVAVIKAVHLLGQASLDEVLDALTALREGTPIPARALCPPPSPNPCPPPQATPPASSAPATPLPRTQAPAKPVSAPDPAKPVSPSPTPVAASPTSSSEDTTIDASVAWSRVASTFEHSLMYAWMAHGVFDSLEANTIRILFPPSNAGEISSLVGKKARTEAEQKLTDILGRKTQIIFETSPTVPEPVIPDLEPEPEPESLSTKPSAPFSPTVTTPAPPASNAADDFKNDPLIRKALEIFQAELGSDN